MFFNESTFISYKESIEVIYIYILVYPDNKRLYSFIEIHLFSAILVVKELKPVTRDQERLVHALEELLVEDWSLLHESPSF